MRLHTCRFDEDVRSKINLNICTDNCAGQFKCKYSVWFLAWWVIVAEPMFQASTRSIRQLFQLAGHTKFAPDRGFAAIRIALKSESVYTPEQCFDLVNSRASKINEATKSSAVTFVDWKSFLSQFFVAKIPKISERHELLFHSEYPGVVQARSCCTGLFSTVNLFHEHISTRDVLQPAEAGLREWFHPDFQISNPEISSKRHVQLQHIAHNYSAHIPSYEAYTKFL